MNTNVLNKKKLITSIIFKAISLIASVYGLVFTIDSIKSFTFFTTLSNVALDIVLAMLYCLLRKRIIRAMGFIFLNSL